MKVYIELLSGRPFGIVGYVVSFCVPEGIFHVDYCEYHFASQSGLDICHCWYLVSLPFDDLLSGLGSRQILTFSFFSFFYHEIVKPVRPAFDVLCNTLLLQFCQRLLEFRSLCIWYDSRMLYHRNSVCLKLDVIRFVIPSYSFKHILVLLDKLLSGVTWLYIHKHHIVHTPVEI